MKSVRLFSDGSCLGNPGAGGWAFVLEYGAHRLEKSGGETQTTNNQMELKGVINGLKALKEPCAVELFTDSSYVVNGINSWLKSWLKSGWKNSAKQPVKNKELWLELNELLGIHDVKANWVKGHAGHSQNELCDTLARNEAQKFKG